jgi:hypothetical protein
MTGILPTSLPLATANAIAEDDLMLLWDSSSAALKKVLFAVMRDKLAAALGLISSTAPKAKPVISGGAIDLDFSNGFADVILNANITAITVSNVLASDLLGQVLILTVIGDGTARTVAWPSGNGISTLKFNWPAGTPPTALTGTADKRDRISLIPNSPYSVDCYLMGQNS